MGDVGDCSTSSNGAGVTVHDGTLLPDVQGRSAAAIRLSKVRDGEKEALERNWLTGSQWQGLRHGLRSAFSLSSARNPSHRRFFLTATAIMLVLGISWFVLAEGTGRIQSAAVSVLPRAFQCKYSLAAVNTTTETSGGSEASGVEAMASKCGSGGADNGEHTPATRRLDIRSGTILYLVTGKGYPAMHWIRRARWANVSFFFLSWKENATAALTSREQYLISRNKLRAAHFAGSTWTTARNRLAKLACSWERDLGWRFEMMVFMDEDVKLIRRLQPANQQTLGESSDDVAFRYLNVLLRRDRPMRAGVMYIYPTQEMTCRRRCHLDHALVAMHRTALDFLMPYVSLMDDESWWYSAAISNHYARALYPDYCTEYQELMVDRSSQQHGNYPTGPKITQFLTMKRFVAACLTLAGAPGFRAGMPDEELRVVFAEKKSAAPSCMSSQAGIDYSAIADREHWRTFMKCLPE